MNSKWSSHLHRSWRIVDGMGIVQSIEYVCEMRISRLVEFIPGFRVAKGRR